MDREMHRHRRRLAAGNSDLKTNTYQHDQPPCVFSGYNRHEGRKFREVHGLSRSDCRQSRK
ncbi:hypothetical protein RHIZ404_230216 [Rhizobium sp. EC-SD404]|nr:hypothetical protein RHIZ404_230216 [Rhizobium sp. EC-SD404]